MSGLVHVLDISSNSLISDFETTLNELKQYKKELLDKEIILGISKSFKFLLLKVPSSKNKNKYSKIFLFFFKSIF